MFSNPDLVNLIWIGETAWELDHLIETGVKNQTPSSRQLVQEYHP